MMGQMTDPTSPTAPAGEGRRTNRLIGEMSPYLLQHAHNPVDWYPWGPEALERAKTLDRPILLSIGYAACHWCHVMERESFEDEITAAYMNGHFVCIKVDREERPDLDSIYMDAVQVLTGQGGWPMTMFLTPEGVPFHGGTYFPPTDRGGMPSFLRVLRAVSDTWDARRDEIRRQSGQVLERLQMLAGLASPPAEGGEPLGAAVIDKTVAELGSRFDRAHGGFGRAPKFPQPPILDLLMRVSSGPAGAEPAREMVEFTLGRMAHQGIYDQVGGGFHRYAVDREWLVPHFEKMLYDNAQLARLYTHAWQAWTVPAYRRIAEETLGYLLRDLRDPAGGFASSEDADSEGHEGKFYVWDYAEVQAVAPSSIEYFGVTKGGNFEGRTILTASSDEPPAGAVAALLEARAQRVRPARDGKVLTSWNGLAISALADAGAAFGRADFVRAAEEAAGFLLEAARDDRGRLLHAYKDGRASVLGMMEDHAYLADGLFALWEATFEPRWFEASLGLAREMLERFWDPAAGGFFSTASDHESLLVRQKELIESVTPSPNGVAALLLQKLAIVTGDQTLQERALELLGVARGLMEASPISVPSLVSALSFHLARGKEVVVVADGSLDAAAPLLAVIRARYLPNAVLVGSPPGIATPLLEGKTPRAGAPTAYVCEGYACRAPTTDPDLLARQLEA